jgi:hypothetical protein
MAPAISRISAGLSYGFDMTDTDLIAHCYSCSEEEHTCRPQDSGTKVEESVICLNMLDNMLDNPIREANS